jgi:BolA protein
MSMDDIIKQKIEEALAPESLELVNESYKHKGHAGDDGSGETHYILKVVSKRFDGLSRVERQKLIHEILSEELKNGIHALSMHLITP